MKLGHIIRFLFLAITICGCHHDQHKHYPKKHKQKSTTNKDTLFVTTRSAISVWLDTATLEKRRKQYGDDSFYTVSDDEVYYSSQADSVLRSHKLPIIDAREYKYLKFVQYNKLSKVIKVDTLSFIHTVYLFDPSKMPLNVDVTDIENEYNEFYH
jgi:hypothetical protein